MKQPMAIQTATVEDVRRAQDVIRRHVGSVPLTRSYALERELGLSDGRCAWLKDYGWTPVGSFKLLGALNWTANNLDVIGNRPIVAHSSGNFASGIAYAGMRYKKRVIIVMPQSAPTLKFELTRSFGAEIRTYDIDTDHLTGERDRLTEEIVEKEGAIQASPYDDNHVIAGNGVGGLEIVTELMKAGRDVSHFLCQVSGGGLMAGHALAVAEGFPTAAIIGIEPEGADDYCQSVNRGERVRIDRPQSICDGLLSYDVGEHNWPILYQHVRQVATVADLDTCAAMRWLYRIHGLRTEPSGAIAVAAALTRTVELDGDGDVVMVVSGRNADEDSFRQWIETTA